MLVNVCWGPQLGVALCQGFRVWGLCYVAVCKGCGVGFAGWWLWRVLVAVCGSCGVWEQQRVEVAVCRDLKV